MSFERAMDPSIDPERMAHALFNQIELPLNDTRLNMSEVTARNRKWITESNASLAAALAEAAKRLSNMTDKEYYEQLDMKFHSPNHG